ncbi:MAG: hypothetical protein MJ252_12935 [archaeon]|nr:hypothetical protein [archaeon]
MLDGFLGLDPSNQGKLKRIEPAENSQSVIDKASQPWVEKYRPNNLDEVVFQENVVQALKNTKETGKMPHLLLYGPPGTGKTSCILAVRK